MMSSAHDPLLALWAKTDRKNPDSGRYHPLICHMIDVAVVARAMWHEVLTPVLRKRVADGLGLDDAVAETWVTYLAGLHDLGKASPGFQAKHPPLEAQLAAAGLTPGHREHDPGHGTVTTLTLKPFLEACGMPSLLALELATAVGGHHGIFPPSARFHDFKKQVWLGDDGWDSARTLLARQLAALLAVPKDAPTRTDHPTCMVLAGLVSVADWIGSDSDRFQFARAAELTNEDALRAYLAGAEAIAERALTDLGWRDWTAAVESLPFETLFGFQPRAVQQQVAELPGILDGPGIVIVELPMGEGKTEAAFYLADRWAQALGQRGVYVAMPTMATSNGMFGRLIGYLEHRFPAGRLNVQLIHSHAAIAPELEALRHDDPRLPIDPDDISGDEGLRNTPAEVVVAEWFSRRKRGLLAPYGVGTVDQALLAALQVPHVFVRTFGLAGKTVIFDEVHAYDTYMSALFDRLLEWLGALGSSVVVLTATLPRARRDDLLQKYARGAGTDTKTSAVPAKYPRLSWVSRQGADARSVELATLSDLSKRELHLRWVGMRLPKNDGEPFPLGEQLRDALRDGGCAAVICNTVGRAQRMYQQVARYFAEDEVDLLHARFPFEERDAREKRALVRFGKPDGTVVTEAGSQPVERPFRSVLVATQIVEQSLDLDFDLIVTDLAPADLVLQRSGRLQRHPRQRPPAFRDRAVLWVGEPEETSQGVPRFDEGSEVIYDSHVLLRSWLALKECTTIAFPTDIEEIIEAVYDRKRDCPSSDPAVHERWEQTRTKLQEGEKQLQQEAQTKWTLAPHADDLLWRMTRDPTKEDAPEAHRQFQALTRLTLPTVSVVALWNTPRGVSYDPAGERPANVSSQPDLAETKHLLRRAVSVSHRGAFWELIALDPPPAWKKSSLLRHHRLVTLDANNQFDTDRYTLELDPRLGLLIKRREEA